MYAEKFNMNSLMNGWKKIEGHFYYCKNRTQSTDFILSIVPTFLECTIEDLIPVYNDLKSKKSDNEYSFPFRTNFDLEEIKKRLISIGVDEEFGLKAFFTFKQNCFLAPANDVEDSYILASSKTLPENSSIERQPICFEREVYASGVNVYKLFFGHKREYSVSRAEYQEITQKDMVSTKIKNLKEIINIGKKYGMTVADTVVSVNYLFDFLTEHPFEEYLLSDEDEKIVWINVAPNEPIFEHYIRVFFEKAKKKINLDSFKEIGAYIKEVYTVLLGEDIANIKTVHFDKYTAIFDREKTFVVTPNQLSDLIKHLRDAYGMDEKKSLSTMRNFFYFGTTQQASYKNNNDCSFVVEIKEKTVDELNEMFIFFKDKNNLAADKILNCIKYIYDTLFPGITDVILSNLAKYEEQDLRNIYICRANVIEATNVFEEYISFKRTNDARDFGKSLLKMLLSKEINDKDLSDGLLFENCDNFSPAALFTVRNFLISEDIPKDLEENLLKDFVVKLIGSTKAELLLTNLNSEKYTAVKSMLE